MKKYLQFIAEAKRESLLENQTRHLADSIGAPSHATVHETGGAHGGGHIAYSHDAEHKDVHKKLTKAGFIKDSSKRHTQNTKMGRSAAISSAKIQQSQYTHPSGHTATVKTTTPKYGNGPNSFVMVHTKK